MAKNTCLLYATTRPRVFDGARGLTMPRTPEWVICGVDAHTLVSVFVMPGISVPISRGSPPLQTE